MRFEFRPSVRELAIIPENERDVVFMQEIAVISAGVTAQNPDADFRTELTIGNGGEVDISKEAVVHIRQFEINLKFIELAEARR